MPENTTNLKSLLTDPNLLETQAYVNGAWIEGDKGTFDVINPARGDVIAQVSDLSRTQISDAIACAETCTPAVCRDVSSQCSGPRAAATICCSSQTPSD